MQGRDGGLRPFHRDRDEQALTRAVETARLAVGDGGGTLASRPAAHQRRSMATATRWRMRNSREIDTLREIDAFARALDPRVVQVSASMAASIQEVEILRPEGHMVRDVRPMTSKGP